MLVNPFHHRRILALSLIFFVLAMIWMGLLLRVYIKDLPEVDTLGDYSPSLITRIYDVRNQLVSELFVERRTVLTLAQIPLDFQHAEIATEDMNFYKHWGVDPKGIFRAMLTNLRARRALQGGSTITQQLAKNIFLSQRRTLERKIKELLLTVQMERNFSKDEILQLYFNQIYFGHGAYGVESAAHVFFGKKSQDLSLAQCALLAGLPKNPVSYSPFNHPHLAVRRRNLVLNRMREAGFITEREQLKAVGEPLGTLKEPLPPSQASYFVEYLRRDLEPKYGTTALYRGGLSVYTTLDMRMQKAAEDSAAKNLEAFDKRYSAERMLYLLKNKKVTQAYYNKWYKLKDKPEELEAAEDMQEPVDVQGALVAVDPQTGGIRAMVGGRDFQKSKFNRAVQARRQPGSTFKPFVYLSAMESGFTPATVVNDYPLAFTDVVHHPRLVAEATDYAMLRQMVTGYYTVDRKPEDPDPIWAPQNWDYKYLGPITLRRALALSRNLVSIRLVDRVGPQTVIDFARRCGIESPLEPVLSLGLGTLVVTPLELVSAISTFDNAGVHMQPFAITRVVNKEGRVLEEHTPQGKSGITPQAAYLVSHLMQAVVKEGTGRHVLQLGRPAAGKTGTTQDQRDVWFVGFVPGLVAGCWIGYDDFTPLGKKVQSAGTSVPWWTDFMAQAGKYVPVKDFEIPPGIVFAKIDADSGMLALPSCPHVVLEAFRQDKVPQEFCNVDHEGLIGAPEKGSDITE